MPQYFSPGVYIEEIEAGPHPIQGVSTSTTGMVGVTARGPTEGKPQLVTSFAEYQRTFGSYLPADAVAPTVSSRWQDLTNTEGGRWWLFPYAVQGFFENGGEQLFVKRVVASGADEASVNLVGGLVSTVASNAIAGDTKIQLDSLVGIDATAGRQFTLVWRDGGNPASVTVNISQYDSAKNTVTLSSGLARAVRAGRDFIVVKPTPAQLAAGGAAPPTALAVRAAAAGGWGNGVTVQVAPMVTRLRLLPDPSEGQGFVTQLAAAAVAADQTVTVTTVPGLSQNSPPTPFWVQITGEIFRVTAVAAGANAGQVVLTLGANLGSDCPLGTTVTRARRANPGGAGPTLPVSGAGTLYPGAIVELDKGTTKETCLVVSVRGNVVTFRDNVAAGYFDTHFLNLVEARLIVAFTDEAGNLTEESFSNLHLVQSRTDRGMEVVNDSSQLVTVTQPASLADPDNFLLPIPPSVTTSDPVANLTNGADNFDTLVPSDFVGTDGGSGHRTGIQALEDIDEIAICAVPGLWSGTVLSTLIELCQTLKDRFAVLDPPDPQSIQEIMDFRANYDTEYAALYYPWLVVLDPVTNANLTVPPSGHMAGIYAGVDAARGVHKAPANVVINGIKVPGGIAQDVNKREQDLLNPKGINAFRAFPNLGQRVWGARTISSDTLWKYINVRRLFIFIEKSIYLGTQWVVFEPNGPELWALVRQTIANFLTTCWRNGQLMGTTPDEAFFVTCDRTTMTEDDLQNGRLICVIGIAPVFPAEFVIFRIEQKTSQLQTS
jgi:phage tail sheath protein FI